MVEAEEERDYLNEETFDDAEIGDWEVGHEQFVLESKGGPPQAPSVDELSKFWDPSEGFSFLWQSSDVVDVESSIQKLVCEDESFEDPAILDVEKSTSKKLNNEALLNLQQTPAYPKVATDLFSRSKDIWSINNMENIVEPNNIARNISVSKPHNFTNSMRGLDISAKSANQNVSYNPILNFVREHQNSSQQPSNLSRYSSQYNNNYTDLRKTHDPQKKLSSNFNSGDLQRNEMSISGMNPSLRNLELINKQNRTYNAFSAFNNQFGTNNLTADYLSRPGVLPSRNFFQCTPPPIHFNSSSNADSLMYRPSNLAKPSMNAIPSNPFAFQNSTMSNQSNMNVNFQNCIRYQHVDNCESWMTEFETMGVLISHLRPLMTSNPYVQDYYFAKRCINRMNAKRSGLANSSSVVTMNIPIPVSFELVNNCTAMHQMALKRKFVIGYASTNWGLVADNSAKPTETDAGGQTGALGKRTRSNCYGQRVVAELSLVSALTEDGAVGRPNDDYNSSVQIQPFNICPKEVMPSRLRLTLFAQIERMFSIVLILDEVNLSLTKVVIHNDARSRLLDYRKQLVGRLAGEFFKSDQKSDDELFLKMEKSGNLLRFTKELFTVGKGIQLFASTIINFPLSFNVSYLSEFIGDFANIKAHSLTKWDKACALLYPVFRDLIYQILSINNFLHSLFPEAENVQNLQTCLPSQNLRSLLTCKFGLSLICCLLDACARASNPADPSEFISFGVFFSYANSLTEPVSEPVSIYTIEPFPHLVSILLLYVKPAKHAPLTAEHLVHFCSLMDDGDAVKSATADICSDLTDNLNKLVFQNPPAYSNGNHSIV